MAQFGFAQVKLGTASAAAVTGVTHDQGIADPNDRPGWLYTKALEDPITDTKFNWFYMGGQYEDLKYRSLDCMYCIVTIDVWKANPSLLPWMSMYTKMKGDGQDGGAFFRSHLRMHVNTGQQIVRVGERVCFWHGKKHPPVEVTGGARLMQCSATALVGPAIEPTDQILYMNLQSDSSAPEGQCLVEMMGYETNASREDRTEFNLHLVT